MQTKQAQSIRRLTTAGVLAAAIVLLTTLVSIPMPGGFGYINLGDVGVLLAGMLLGGGWGALCAGAASALSDVLLGYTVYAPATFVIKGLMALIAFYGFKALSAKTGSLTARILSGAAAELWMVLGYYLFEGCLYGFVPSAVNIPANGVQGAAGLILGVLLVKALEKSRVIKQA